MAALFALRRTGRSHSMLIRDSESLGAAGESFWLSLSYFSLSRLVVIGLLMITFLLSTGAIDLGQTDPAAFQRTLVAYGIFAGMFTYLALSRRRRFHLQLAAQLVLDLTAITFLMHASGGLKGGIAVLYLMPIAGAAIMSPLILAVGYAAGASLTILGETLARSFSGDPNAANTLQAGLYGLACFAIALVINRLAGRLIAQQEIAQRRGLDLERQIEINRVVVADMQDGVLVLAEDGSPSAMNPAAARMLRVTNPEMLVRVGWGEHGTGRKIQQLFVGWLQNQGSVPETFELTVGEEVGDVAGLGVERLRGRFVSARRNRLASSHVVFFEDLERADERAQQLKLASMGRLTASIAHEIRNPLAAISHATALLNEGVLEKPEKRLLGIVQDNTRRLDRIVENILQLSRRDPVQPDEIDLEAFLNEVIEEFCRDQAFPVDGVDVSVYGRPLVYFNRDHLRQVLMNLLQNAQRHASGAPASVTIIVVPVVPHVLSAEPARGIVSPRNVERIELIVQDDGTGIGAETRRHLFEPFFTTHHRGTGLGLYLARELCLANGGTLGYVPNSDVSKKGGFVINAAGYLIPAEEKVREVSVKMNQSADE